MAMPPNGASVVGVPANAAPTRLPENSSMPASISQSAARPTRRPRVPGDSATSATPCPNASAAASCSRAWSGPCATWDARAASATAPAAASAPEAPSRSLAPRTIRLAEPPVDVVLALGGERGIDAVLVHLERLHRLLVLGHGPGADRVAHVLQLRHVADVGAGSVAARLGALVLHRTQQFEAFQRLAGRSGDLRQRLHFRLR